MHIKIRNVQFEASNVGHESLLYGSMNIIVKNKSYKRMLHLFRQPDTSLITPWFTLCKIFQNLYLELINFKIFIAHKDYFEISTIQIYKYI